MNLDLDRLFEAFAPNLTLDLNCSDDENLYIDFSEVRGGHVIKSLQRRISSLKDKPTCQLFTGHFGCGKSTELSKLEKELNNQGFHVVSFECTEEFDTADVEITDVLLAITHQITRSLETKANIWLQPSNFKQILQNFINLLNSPVTGFKFKKLPVIGEIGWTSDKNKYSISFGIGEITGIAKNDSSIRSLLREYMAPRITDIINAINNELLIPAQQELSKKGKLGLVVIVDNLDRAEYFSSSNSNRDQPKSLFVDGAEHLKGLKCHLVYTMPLILNFSNYQDIIKQRFGTRPQVLPMVRVKERDGSLCDEGIELLRQMVLARAFPEATKEKRSDREQRLNLILKLFDKPDTFDHLCQMSGGHIRTLLGYITQCLEMQDPPFPRSLIDRIINENRNQLRQGIESHEWQLLREVTQQKKASGEEQYQILVRSSFIFEYRNEHGEIWHDINPILADAEEFKESNE